MSKFGIVSGLDGVSEVLASSFSATTAHLTESGEALLLDLHHQENGARTAHLTHVHCVGGASLADTLSSIAQDVAERFSAPGIRLSDVELTGTWLFWEPLELPVPVKSLHTAVLSRWEKVYSELGLAPVPLGWNPPTDMQASVERYGYPNCGEAWKPHVTVNVLTDENAGRTFPAVPHIATLSSLKVVEVDDVGAIAKVLSEHPLR